MTRRDKALQFRAATKFSAQSATDAQALVMPSMYSYWEKDTKYGGEGEPSIVRRIVDGKERLFRCRQPHTSQEKYPPEIIPALWAGIHASNAGTMDDPIPAQRGMEYVYGLYYTDPEDGKLYVCYRFGEADGGKIILQYLPHELIGSYFAEVTI